MIDSKRGQEEIVGFVVVVVLIAIVALVILSFSLGRPEEARESALLSRFIEAANEYTTNCSVSGSNNFLSLGELYGICYQGTRCDDESDSCTVLNDTLRDLVSTSLRVGEERPLKGYLVRVSYSEFVNGSQETSTPILTLMAGNCSTGQQRGSSDLRYARGGLIRSSIATCT